MPKFLMTQDAAQIIKKGRDTILYYANSGRLHRSALSPARGYFFARMSSDARRSVEKAGRSTRADAPTEACEQWKKAGCENRGINRCEINRGAVPLSPWEARPQHQKVNNDAQNHRSRQGFIQDKIPNFSERLS